MGTTPKPKPIYTRSALLQQMSDAVENIGRARGASRTLCRGDAAIQLRHLDELDAASKQLRRTLRYVAKREALASEEEKTSSSEPSSSEAPR